MFARFHDLNSRAARICAEVVQRADEWEVGVQANGQTTVLDFGVQRIGTWKGAIQLSRICMSGLCDVRLMPPTGSLGLPHMMVGTDFPLEACIASQYAGFPFSHEDFYAMCSGPGRLVRGREPILEAYDLSETSFERVLVLESDRCPNADQLQSLANELPGDGHLWVCVASTHSLPGTGQVVARSVETCMHKLYELAFDLRRVRRALGVAPIPPLGATSFQSLGRTNDAILYGGDVQLWVEPQADRANNDEADRGGAESIQPTGTDSLLEKLPSASSPDFGEPFETIFKKYNHDFYQVDRMLFSPARVVWHDVAGGTIASTGRLRYDLLTSWWFPGTTQT